MKKFEIPNFYKSSIIAEIKKIRKEKDPKKKIEDIYKNSPNVLATVERLRKGIESANSVLNNTKNRSSFTFIPLSRSVASEKNILKEVDKVLDTCKKLDEKGLKLTS